MSVLALHTQRLTDLLPLLEATRPKWVKAVNPDGASVRRCNELGIKVLARYSGNWDMGEPSVVLARNFAAYCASQDSFNDVWGIETPNEPHPGSSWWLAAAVRELRRRRPDLYVVVGNWGNGWDGFPVEVAPEDKAWIIYGAHEYGDPRCCDLIMSLPAYHALRHQDLGQSPGQGGWFERMVLPTQPTAKLMITEFGLTDAAAANGYQKGDDAGWLYYRALSLAYPQTYWASVQQYLSRLKTYVLGAFWFDWGVFPPWESHEGLGTELEQYYRAYAQESRPESASSGPQGHSGEEEEAMPDYVLGFKEVADRLGRAVVGEPETDEKTLKGPDGRNIMTVQSTTKGFMFYMDGGSPKYLPAVE